MGLPLLGMRGYRREAHRGVPGPLLKTPGAEFHRESSSATRKLPEAPRQNKFQNYRRGKSTQAKICSSDEDLTCSWNLNDKTFVPSQCYLYAKPVCLRLVVNYVSFTCLMSNVGVKIFPVGSKNISLVLNRSDPKLPN